MLLLDNLITINTLRLRINAQSAIHCETASLAELVDSPHGVDSTVQRATRIEVLFDRWQQIFARADLSAVGGQINPRVLESFVGCHPGLWVDCQTAVDEVARFLRYTAPVLDRREGVVCC